MRKIIVGVVFVLLGGLSAAAQGTPKVEAFGGYSYVRISPPGSSGVPSFGLNGGTGSISFNPIPVLGVVADFGGYHTGKIAGVPVSATLYTYLFGPKVALRRGRVTPFAQALFGGTHGVASAAGVGSASGNDFTMTVGGGLDANLSRHIAIRLIQGEYMLIRDSGGHLNSARISAGIVFQFGK